MKELNLAVDQKLTDADKYVDAKRENLKHKIDDANKKVQEGADHTGSEALNILSKSRGFMDIKK